MPNKIGSLPSSASFSNKVKTKISLGISLGIAAVLTLTNTNSAQSQEYPPLDDNFHSISQNNFSYPSAITTSPNQRTSPSQNQILKKIAKLAMPSNIALTMHGEATDSRGSAVIIGRPKILEPFLYGDEVAAVSVAHNFSDWGPRCSLTATMFYDFDPELKPKKSRNYSARLISRFLRVDTKDKRLDIAITALRVPSDQDRSYIRGIVRPLAPKGTKYNLGDKAVLIGSPGKEGTPIAKNGPNIPEWRDARIIEPQVENYETQHGKLSNTVYNTIAESRSGQSGGGLYDLKGRLIGLCVGGGAVPKDTVDFVPKNADKIVTIPPGSSTEDFEAGTIFTYSQYEYEAKTRELARETAGWAMDVTFRNGSTSIDRLHDLAILTRQRYGKLQIQRKQILRSTQELAQELRSLEPKDHTRNMNNLSVLNQYSLRWINQEISKLKPPR